MRKIILSIILLLSVSTVSAQQKQYRFALTRDYDKIIVEQGWDAVLVQSGSPNDVAELQFEGFADTLNYLVVECADTVKPSQVFRLLEGSLRIKENKHLPADTRVVVHTARRIHRIELMPKAQLSMPGRFEGYGDLTFAQWGHSRLIADTLASASLLFGYKGDSCYFYCRHQEFMQSLTNQDFGKRYGSEPCEVGGTPDSNHYGNSFCESSVYRMNDIWYEAPSVRFHENMTIHLGVGFRLLANLCNNDVYNESNILYVTKKNDFYVPLYLKWKIDRRFDCRLGLQYNWFTSTLLANPVLEDEVSIGEIDPSYYYARTTIDHHFIGVPFSITYHPIRRNREALGLTAGLLVSHELRPATVSTEYRLSANQITGMGSTTHMVNPWRIEMQLGVETNLLGLIHGVQFYYSLLPTYRDFPETNRCHEFGVALFL